jgi:APA family basic amino acid/polyamine antiporter
MLFGQTRIFFVMARDGLLPEKLASIHPKWKTPHIVTMITGVAVALFAAFLPVGKLADISNSGTLFAFFMVALAVLILRVRDPHRHRPFRTPFIWIVAPLAILGTLGLYANLPTEAKLVLPLWGGLGLIFYYLYGYRKSHVGRGITEAADTETSAN